MSSELCTDNVSEWFVVASNGYLDAHSPIQQFVVCEDTVPEAAILVHPSEV